MVSGLIAQLGYCSSQAARSGDGVIARTLAGRLNDLLFIVQTASIIVEAFTFKRRRLYALLLAAG